MSRNGEGTVGKRVVGIVKSAGEVLVGCNVEELV